VTRIAGRHVVLGVSGGIACYKSCVVARRLTEAGVSVEVVMSAAAAEFVGPVTFEALTGHPVITSLWQSGRALDHVRLGREADLVVVVPATAHLIARMAQGMADDFLTALLLAGRAPVLLCPAMNDQMYAHPETQANLALLKSRGVHVLGPVTGPLARGEGEGPGRMVEPEEIVAQVERLLRTAAPWAGRRVLVTAGPTREALDPVRVVSNRSSGRMGFALARAAWLRGADVTLVSGPTALEPPPGVSIVRVQSTAEMAAAVADALPLADLLVMAAAPADYQPAAPLERKAKRGEGGLKLELEPTPDILAGTATRRKKGAVIVGFALETGDAVAGAQAKLKAKQLDLVVANDAAEPDAGPEAPTNRVTIVSRTGVEPLPLLEKGEAAEAILDRVQVLLSKGA
jgi:phosphopantothenoylcysteine decarboxylase/phosphopantothenate--cysteine ligase